MQSIDNVTSFRYFFNPKIVIIDPNYIISIKALESNNIYYYGTYMHPGSLKEIMCFIEDYMYANEEYELFNFKESNFKVTIKKTFYDN